MFKGVVRSIALAAVFPVLAPVAVAGVMVSAGATALRTVFSGMTPAQRANGADSQARIAEYNANVNAARANGVRHPETQIQPPMQQQYEHQFKPVN